MVSYCAVCHARWVIAVTRVSVGIRTGVARKRSQLSGSVTSLVVDVQPTRCIRQEMHTFIQNCMIIRELNKSYNVFLCFIYSIDLPLEKHQAAGLYINFQGIPCTFVATRIKHNTTDCGFVASWLPPE